VKFTLYPAGNCAHCGEAINESHLMEGIARPPWPGAIGGGFRMVTILVHTEWGHERCEGRETLAERQPPTATT
jgi:hypothetical protein